MLKKKSLFGLLVALFIGPAFAQATQTFGEKIWWASDHNRMAAEVSKAVGVPHAGIPYTNPPSGSLPYKSGVIVPTAGQWPSGSMRGNLPIEGGPVIDVNAKFKPASTAAALGRFASKVLPPLAAGAAIYDLAKELGFTLDNSGPELIVTKRSSAPLCTVGPCYEYRVVDQGIEGPWETTKSTAASSWANLYNSKPCLGKVRVTYTHTGEITSNTYANYDVVITNYSSNNCQDPLGSDNSTTQNIISSRQIPPSTGDVEEPSTLQSFVDEIASQSGWPSSSSITPAIKDALESGENPEMETPTVSGPSSQIINQSTTNNTTNNTTSTTTNTQNYTYEGNEVTINNTSVTLTTNNSTGETSTSTTNDAPRVETIKEETPFEMPCGISGKSPCNVKIDESGMPPIPPNPYGHAEDEMDGVKSSTQTAIDAVTNDVVLPEWSWTFQLPEGCSPLPLEGYGLSIDVCEFKPVIHDLMSLLWVAAGIFGLLGLARSAFEG